MSRLDKFTALPLGASESGIDTCEIGCQDSNPNCEACYWCFPKDKSNPYLCAYTDQLGMETPLEINQLVKEHL